MDGILRGLSITTQQTGDGSFLMLVPVRRIHPLHLSGYEPVGSGGHPREAISFEISAQKAKFAHFR